MDELYINGLKRNIKFSNILTNLKLCNNDIVYIGGSLIEGTIGKYSDGMGNEKSDFDLFIIRESESFIKSDFVYDDKFKKTYFINNNNNGFDIEIYNKDNIYQLISSINNFEYVFNKRILNMIDFPEGWSLEETNSFLTRLKYSICLVNEEEYTNLKKNIKYDKFLHLYKEYTINCLDNSFDDLIGNIRNKTYDTALFCIRSTFILLLEIIIMKENDFIDREKWATLKFTNIVNKTQKYQDVMKQYKRLFLGDLSNNDILCNEIHNTISLIHHILEENYIDFEI